MRLRGLARSGFAALAIVSIATLAPAATSGAATASHAPTGSTWHLVGHHQMACFDTNVHDAWYGVFINGTWTSPIEVGLKGLPAGGTFTTSYTPIAPGSANGRLTLAYADAKLSTTPPIGTYSAVLWAADGTNRDRVRIEIDVKASCGY